MDIYIFWKKFKRIKIYFQKIVEIMNESHNYNFWYGWEQGTDIKKYEFRGASPVANHHEEV